MTNLPYEERIKNRSIDWYYYKCIRQYHFIIKSEGANQRYKEEIKRLTKAKETMENEYDDLLKIFCKLTTEYKKETTQLNKIIERLEKYLLDIYISTGYEELYKIGIKDSYDKLQELKEEGKE